MHRTKFSAILAYFYPNLVVMATLLASSKIPTAYWNSFGSLENSGSKWAYLNSPAPRTLLFMQKFLNFLQKTEISAILAHFCQNLVAMATPLNIYMAYLNSLSPKTLTHT